MKNKFLSIFVALAISFSCFGCTSGGKNEVQVPNFDSQTDKIEFMAYIPPPPANWDGNARNANFINDEQYGYMQDAGFTKAIALYEGLLLGGGTTEQWSAKAQEHALLALAMAEKYNIKYYVRDWKFYGAIHNNNIPMTDMQSSLDKMFDTSNEYIKSPAYMGNYADDEPSAKIFDQLRVMRDMYEKLVPNGEFLVNLLPTYSGRDQLGDVGYKAYIEQFIQKVDLSYVMYDHYPLTTSSEGSEVKPDYLLNLAIVANLTKQYNKEHRGFIQSHSFGGNSRDIGGVDDIRFQTYTNMAFGMSEMAYYTYFSSLENEFYGTDALITSDGKTTFRYDAAKIVNNEVHNFEKAYLSYKWDNMMLFEKPSALINSSFEAVKEGGYVTANHDRIGKSTFDANVIMGTFKKTGDNQDAFMLVNNEDPYYKKTATIKIKFNNARALLMYRFGQQMVMPLDNDNSYEFVLAPGEGRFIIPLE